MKKTILTVSLAAFVAAAFAAETAPADNPQPACPGKDKAKACCPGKAKAAGGMEKAKGECPVQKADAEKKAAESGKK